MLLETQTPRNNYETLLLEQGFTQYKGYWKEDKVFQFKESQILAIEEATNELYRMLMTAVEDVIINNQFSLFKIDSIFHQLIVESWKQHKDSALCGRMDLGYNPLTGEIKLFEFNATPTTLIETSVLQYHRISGLPQNVEQFNSCEEALIEKFQWFKYVKNVNFLHFSCLRNEEDYDHVQYLRRIAEQVGIVTAFLYIDEIGYSTTDDKFVDLDNYIIENLYSLYPHEMAFADDYGNHFSDHIFNCLIEPYWKVIAGSKAILPVLWQLFPNHKYLLPSMFSDEQGVLNRNYVEKSIHGRQGENITLFGDNVFEHTDGHYADQGYIYQERFKLPCIEGVYPVLGSWVINDEACGLSVRADSKLITDNNTPFYPHYFIKD